VSTDKQALLDSLASQRRHVLGILDGLSDDDLRKPVLPSGWSCTGLVHHLALDVERFWFRAVMAGEEVDEGDRPDSENAWEVPPGTTPRQVLELYRAETEHADAVVARMPLDTPPAWWPDFFGSYRLEDLREVLLHVIVETAAHAGHLDAVRELLDGKQWMVLTD
jgi:uncharacterized damage-inducible protein DinB